MKDRPVCILTAGSGTRMGVYGALVNKALLPLGSQAVISQIIAQFPSDTEFVVALGYRGDQVRAYLATAHPQLRVQFVDVDRYEGPGSGPGYSLLCCEAWLRRPFYFVASDTQFSAKAPPPASASWAGVAAVPVERSRHYCNLRVQDSQVVEIRDKQAADEAFMAFTGFLFVHEHELFWRALHDGETVGGEHQISNGLKGLAAHGLLNAVVGDWLDVGDEAKYRSAQASHSAYDFSKTDEFIYFPDQRVVKFFADRNIVAGRAAKAALKPHVFPAIDSVAGQFYGYQRVAGETLYACATREVFRRLLAWLEREVWTEVSVPRLEMRARCETFYRVKTAERLKAFRAKYPDYVAPTVVNGEAVAPVDELLERMPWDLITEGVPTFIHGDLQFDNILYDRVRDSFILLDWRQDFAGAIEYGDLYYDLAKLYGGLTLNYDYIKAGLFRVEHTDHEITIDFAVHAIHQELRADFEGFLAQRRLEFARVRLLLGLIFLNMAPLHHPPFDRALYSLAAQVLTRELLKAYSIV